MASVIAITNMKLEAEQKKAYIDALGTAITTGFGIGPQFRSIMWLPIADDDMSEHTGLVLNLFLFTAPNKPIEAKRQVVKNIQEVTEKFFGAGKVRVVAIMKEHADENVGVDGILRYDAKRSS